MSSHENHQIALESLLNDNSSGSVELLSKLNDWLLQHTDQVSSNPELIKKLLNHFSEFQTIVNYLNEVNEQIKTGSSENLKSYFREFNRKSNQVLERLFVNAITEIGKFTKFLTISNSGQLFYILSRYAKNQPNLEVTVCESRPAFEGRVFAAKLAENAINTTIITEAMIPEFLEKCDSVLIGSDQILNDGSVVNKVGSRLLAISAKHFGKPFYVITDKSKYNDKFIYTPTEYPSEEIWANPKNIKIHNYYFEMIEKSLIKKIIED